MDDPGGRRIIYGAFFASYLQDEAGLTGPQAGALWSLVGFLTIFSGLIGGFFYDRIGRYWGFTTLFVGQGLALLFLALSHAVIPLYASIVLYGLSLWGFPVLLAVSCGDLFGPRLAPAGVGFGMFFFSIGQALGPFITGALYDRTGSFTMPFLIGVLIAALGISATWFRSGGENTGSK